MTTMTKQYVAMGCSTVHDYSFLLPISCLAWRERIGFEPVVFLVGDEDEWSQDDRGKMPCLIALLGHPFRVEFVPHMEGVEDATISQSVRLHAAALRDLEPDALLTPCDADLIPLRRSFYMDNFREPITSLYANGYPGEDATHLPTCHIQARVKTWRAFMGLNGQGIPAALKASFEAAGLAAKMEQRKADPKKNWGWVWFLDEHHLSNRILSSGLAVHRVNREGHPPVDRLDRSCWPETYDPSQYTDGHSIRPGWTPANWPRLRPLLAWALPHHLPWLDAYQKEFHRSMKCDG